MPVKDCRDGGKPGYRWGDSGKCYTYTQGNEQSRKRARDKAIKQGRAIQVNKSELSNLLKSIEELKIKIKEIKEELKGYDSCPPQNIKKIPMPKKKKKK